MVAGNRLDSLDSFIRSVTIYNVGEGSCCDVMGYITITKTIDMQIGLEDSFGIPN